MKIKNLNIIFLLILCGQILNAQENTYNVFEIGKGEILKKDYLNIEYIAENLLIATTIKEGIDDYSDKDLTGVIDFKENIILPFKFRNIRVPKDDFGLYKGKTPLIEISDGKKRKALYAYKEKAFEKITPFKYLKFRPFLFDGNFISAYDGHCQILNLQNGDILKTKFIEVAPLTNNLISTRDLSYKSGVIDRNGKTILKNEYDRIREISDSLIYIKKRDTIGVLSDSGDIIIPPLYRNIELSGNLILAQAFNIEGKIKNKNSSFKKDEKRNSKKSNKTGFYGAFDKKGNNKIPFEYDLLKKGIGSAIIGSKNGAFGIISEELESIIDFKYDDIDIIFDSFYIVKKGRKYGLFTKDGMELLEPNFNQIFPISKNEILYTYGNGWNKISFDDDYSDSKTEENILDINYKLDYFEGKNNGKFFLVSDNNEYGVMNDKLEIIVSAKNSEKGKLFENYFDLGQIYTLKGVLLEDIERPKYYYGDKVKDQNAIVCTKEGRFGVVDIDGKTIVPFKYTYIENIDGKKFVVRK